MYRRRRVKGLPAGQSSGTDCPLARGALFFWKIKDPPTHLSLIYSSACSLMNWGERGVGGSLIFQKNKNNLDIGFLDREEEELCLMTYAFQYVSFITTINENVSIQELSR